MRLHSLRVFLLTLSLATTFSCHAQSQDANSPAKFLSQWQAEGEYSTAHDAALLAPVVTAGNNGLTMTSKTQLPASRTFKAWIRLRSANSQPATATVTLGKHDLKNTKESNLTLSLVGNPAANSVLISAYQDGKPLLDNVEISKSRDYVTAWPSSMNYRVKAYNQALPGWDEDFRIRVEHDMAQLPGVQEKWLNLRIKTKPGVIEYWIDDRLVARKQDATIAPDGYCIVKLSPGAQCAGLENLNLVEAPGFDPIPLQGYANALNFLGDQALDLTSLPALNRLVKVDSVPFIFSGKNPEGNDHLDVGRSFFRQGTLPGYFPAYEQGLGGADQRDPARIQLRIPFKSYKALHLIAAADGEKDSLPLITAQFYRPGAGFSQNFEQRVPLATAKANKIQALSTRLMNGRKVNLYLVTIPLDPGRLSSFSDLNIFEVELTKKVELWRAYPDPVSYGYHAAGLPSGVHVYAATLEETPVGFDWSPDAFGHVWTADQTSGYTATLTNRIGAPLSGQLTVSTRSYDGTETHRFVAPVKLPASSKATKVKIAVPVKLYGYHDVRANLTLDANAQTSAFSWDEKRSLVKLAPNTRSSRWTPGRGALFGYWSYHGGHYTPRPDQIVRVMTLAGARTSSSLPPINAISPETLELMKARWSPPQSHPWDVAAQAWASTEPLDPALVAKFQAETIERLKKTRERIPDLFKPDYVFYFAEPHISARLTSGNIPDYWGEKPYELTEEEESRLKMFYNTAKITSDAVRKELPGLKILIPWGDPGFVWPLLRAGLSKDAIDGSGIDIPGFERIPERQLHEQSIHRLYLVNKEYERAGMEHPRLQFSEGIFVPTEPGAVTWREQMDIYQRTSLIAMAYGVDRFYSSWFAFDAGSYYGAEHYGGCGIQRRIPYMDPKPAYAAYATMTDRLNEANFQNWLPTGSLSNYALHFKSPKGHVYALWNLRGKRPVTLKLSGDAAVQLTDSMNNTRVLRSQNKQVTINTDPSVVYVSFGDGSTQVASAQVGAPDNSDAVQPKEAKVLADLGDGTWRFTNQRDLLLEKNHWAVMHYPGKFSTSPINDAAHGRVLQTKLEKQDKVHQLMPWYNVLKPAKPITIPGAASHLGLWVKGSSDWGRFIYVLRDAKGEQWYSIGEKDQYNCDDTHSWSMFNFDGWRYLTFELPGNAPWDKYRKAGSTWWRFTDGGVADLPLQLEAIIVEQRTHILYVNDVQPVASDTVQFGKLFAQYQSPGDASGEAVRISKLKMPRPVGHASLNNPIADLEKNGTGAPTKLLRLEEPLHYADGTRMHVYFEEVPGAAKYYLYCGPYADGAGAVNMAPVGIQNGQLVASFRPAVPLYFWIVWEDKDKKLSKPSASHRQVLVDNFKEK
jgi:hypothetical protein